ncbi:hypothetical protein JCM8547_004034 [Rhodosporidiobolus lusitaniae]
MTSTSVYNSAARLAAASRHLSAPSPKPPRRPLPPTANEYRFFLPFTTRWADNDQYGHMNNVVYSQYFDSLTNHYLLLHCPPSSPSHPSPPPSSPVTPLTQIGLIVDARTTYSSSLSFPQPVVGALAVEKLGRRSVVWKVALFEGEYCASPFSSTAGSGAAEGEIAEGYRLSDALGGADTGEEAGGAGRQVRIKRDAAGQPVRAAAHGTMTHVFVDRESRAAVEELEERVKKELEKLVVEEKRERE